MEFKQAHFCLFCLVELFHAYRDFWHLFTCFSLICQVRNFTDPSSLEGLSLGTILLAMTGNGLMVPRALFTRDVIWLTGTLWGSLMMGWAQLLSMFIGQSETGWVDHIANGDCFCNHKRHNCIKRVCLATACYAEHPESVFAKHSLKGIFLLSTIAWGWFVCGMKHCLALKAGVLHLSRNSCIKPHVMSIQSRCRRFEKAGVDS